MSISINCESCKKKIKAPDDSGGKWGTCPHCNHRNYIPLPPSPEDEELKLMPLDESDETTYGHLMKETHDLTKDILGETVLPEDDEGDSGPVSEKELIRQIILYVRSMAEGNLSSADELTRKLATHRQQVNDLLARMGRSAQPEPELADIPPRLLQGFLKNLRQKIG